MNLINVMNVYLLLFSLFSFCLSVYILMYFDISRIKMYKSFVLCLFLSFVQIYQTIELFFVSYTYIWWIPLICKHISIGIYLLILKNVIEDYHALHDPVYKS